MKNIICTITIVLVTLCAYGVNDVDKATEALNNKEYTKAIELYQAVLGTGQVSGELHYNMGLAYVELGQIGHAIWQFKLAETEGLRSEDLYHNLTLAKEARKDEIAVVPEFFLTQWWNSWKSILNSNVWGILALLLLCGAIYSFYLWRTAEERGQRKRGFTFGIPLLLMSILCLASAWSQSEDRMDPSHGILLVTELELRSAPDPESAGIVTIHAGADITIQDEIGGWNKVRLANGQLGWILSEQIGLY